MDTQLSDSELLDLSMNFSEDDNERHSYDEHPPMTTTATQNEPQDHQKLTSTTPSTQESESEKQDVRRKSDNTRHTLRKLNHKLDKIHDQLA